MANQLVASLKQSKIPARMLGNFSLRAKLIGAFLIITLLSAGIVGGVAFNRTRQGLIANLSDHLNSQAVAEARGIGTIIEREVTTLRTLGIGVGLQRAIGAANDSYSSLDAAAIQKLLLERDQQWRTAPDTDQLIVQTLSNPIAEDLREYRDNDPDAVELMITDRFGGLVAASNRTTDYYQADEEWWQRTWNDGKGQNYIGQPAFDQSSNTYGLIVSEPVYGHTSSDLIGIIRTTFRLSTLIAQADKIQVGSTGRAQLLISGNKILSPNPPATDLDAESVAQLAAAGKLPSRAIEYQSIRRFVGVAPIVAIPEVTNLGWRLLVYEDEADALAPVNEALGTALITMLGLTLLTLIPAIALAQLISAPIHRITTAARQIAAGDLSQRLASAHSDEIGQLAQSFDTMAQALEQRIASEQLAQAERLRLQEDIIRVQEARLNELSTPLIPLTSAVLLLPLIGSIDSRRADQVFHTLLHGVAQQRARVVILDLTGVPIIDSQVAQALLRAAQGVRLLGAETMLVGIRVEVAQTLVALGADLSNLPIYANLQMAITQVTERQVVQR